MGIFDNQTYTDIATRSKADVAANLPGVDPRIKASFVNTLAVASAGRSYDNILLLKQLLLQLFPQTATGEFLQYFLEFEGLTPLEPTISEGYLSILAPDDTIIPAGTEFKTEDEIDFVSAEEIECGELSFIVLSMVRIDSTVTAVTQSVHQLATGLTVTIIGADQAEYNGDHVVTVLNPTSFSFNISTTPASPATGSIVANFIGASLLIESVETGADKNLESGSIVKPVTQIAGLAESGFAQFDGISGGTDAESTDSQRSRILFSRANPVANFNVAAVTLKAREVTGVTRVFVKRTHPFVGGAEIFFTRDGDPDPIPNTSQIETVKNKIIEIIPITSNAEDIFVKAPIPVRQDFNFVDLRPLEFSEEGKQAIEDNLRSFFLDIQDFEIDVPAEQYRAVIMNTVDPVTGASPTSFTLAEPTGDIDLGDEELALLQNVIFP